MPAILPSVVAGKGSGSVLTILQGTGKSAPSGVDALFSYNGLVMNNRKWADSIIITKIGGLADPDVRMNEEDNPGEHGTTPFDSLYGGRTITLSGHIRAFTLDKLRDMESALKSAFISLEEKPLTIQGRTLESSVVIWCRKYASLAMEEEQTRDDLFVRDFMLTLRASNPRFFSVEEAWQREEFGIVDTFDADTITAGDYKIINGSTAKVAIKEGKLTFKENVSLFLTRQIPEVFVTNPGTQFDYLPKGSFTGSTYGFYVKYIDANNWITVTVDEAGAVTLKVTIAGTETTRVLSYSLGSATVTRSLGTTYRMKAEMRDNSVWFYHGTTAAWTTIGKYELTFTESGVLGELLYGRGVARFVPGTGAPTEHSIDNLIFNAATLSDDQTMEVVNNGNFETQPTIELQGPMTAPKIHIAETDEQLAFKAGAAIAAGEVWKIDIKEGTIVNEAGESKIGKLDPTSDWPQLIEGTNTIRTSAEGMAPAIDVHLVWQVPKLVVRWKHAWF